MKRKLFFNKQTETVMNYFQVQEWLFKKNNFTPPRHRVMYDYEVEDMIKKDTDLTMIRGSVYNLSLRCIENLSNIRTWSTEKKAELILKLYSAIINEDFDTVDYFLGFLTNKILNYPSCAYDNFIRAREDRETISIHKELSKLINIINEGKQFDPAWRFQKQTM